MRRQCYPPDSPAGKGAKWEWAGDKIGEWHTYDMDIQCLIEEAWARVSMRDHLNKFSCDELKNNDSSLIPILFSCLDYVLIFILCNFSSGRENNRCQ